jgi:hypothetical protein
MSSVTIRPAYSLWPTFGEGWVHSRGSVLQRVFAHDVHHCSELNETLGISGLPQVDLWD